MESSKSLGICLGSSSVSVVYLDNFQSSFSIRSASVFPHQGNPKRVLEEIFDNHTPEKIALTGKKFRKMLNLPSISEAEAIELAVENLKLSSDIVISGGGENFIVYFLDKKNKISKVTTGNKCASGTGEFFLQQIKRMNLDVDEALKYGLTGEPYHISGRCSVFCKSDCTHALNKGVPKENVIAGLSKMMAQKIIEITPKLPLKNAIMIGGVSQNLAMLRFFENHFENLIIPNEAPYFEALGAALYALKNGKINIERKHYFRFEHSSFNYHKPLKQFTSLVHFKEINRGIAQTDDVCIIGLDVGSTTTKAVLLRTSDNAILASEYLRTNGDPVKASVECYKGLREQLSVPVKIIGLGVTGSGRQIAGLHAMTKGVINEIIAHATAAIYFDKDVDTIFEIGGQDAKYTYITSGVASDYAMNEACSAGTGSFLEEAAKTSLDTEYTEIGAIALASDNPPNFNDQCAAFISSDIKNAINEGISNDNILAGLVYSVCMNYNNRVRGDRPVGQKIFMQGGVCYNKAVPVAMAALTGKEIIVPPEPGLMGAFGVALEIKNRLNLSLMEEKNFTIDSLIDRQVHYEKSFICAGGTEKCDRKCEISLFRIDGKKYPFGGACNKYYNLLLDIKPANEENDLVKYRQHLVFEKYIQPVELDVNAPTIGISKSFLTNTLYPLYYNFFTQIGFKVILGDEFKSSGIEKKEAAFCYPVELAHGLFQDLIDKKPDYIFIPHIKESLSSDKQSDKKTCVFLQAESYYLKTTFKDSIGGIKILSPVLDFSESYESEKEKFIELAKELVPNGWITKKGRKSASAAFDFACGKLAEMLLEFKEAGENYLKKLENEPQRFAVVLFGRSYNAFVSEANLGVPKKFVSGNIDIIPHEFLPCDDFESYNHMYWASGQQILKAARFVKNHNQLFGTYITNFSCGPDSFIISYFRNIMGKKPSLTIEIDSHSADVGINTRVEAAIEIFRSYRELNKIGVKKKHSSDFSPLCVNNSNQVVDADGNIFSLTNTQVKMLIPSMGRLGTEAFSAAFRFCGINSEPLPVYDFNMLIAGRGNTTCKECLPLILITGAITEYYREKNPDEKALIFVPESTGPCRLGQYHIFLNDFIQKQELRNIGIFTLTDKNAYEGLDDEFNIRGWTAITISDVMKDIHNAIQSLAVDRKTANEIFENEFRKIVTCIETAQLQDVYRMLEQSAFELSKIQRKKSIERAKKVALAGEIFVRHDDFSKADLLERLSEQEFVVKIIPIGEYVYYSNFLAERDIRNQSFNFRQWLRLKLKARKQKEIEKNIKKSLSKSGFYEFELTDVDEVIKRASPFIKTDLEGEAILTVGSAFQEILDRVCGVIMISPFGCMPSRVAESILNVEMNIEGKLKSERKRKSKFNYEIEELPFLAIETDGNLFPSIIQSKIEIFMMQADRVHQKMMLKFVTTTHQQSRFIGMSIE